MLPNNVPPLPPAEMRVGYSNRRLIPQVRGGILMRLQPPPSLSSRKQVVCWAWDTGLFVLHLMRTRETRRDRHLQGLHDPLTQTKLHPSSQSALLLRPSTPAISSAERRSRLTLSISAGAQGVRQPGRHIFGNVVTLCILSRRRLAHGNLLFQLGHRVVSAHDSEPVAQSRPGQPREQVSLRVCPQTRFLAKVRPVCPRHAYGTPTARPANQ